MDKRLIHRLKHVQPQAGDAKTPQDNVTPFEHSTSKKSDSSSGSGPRKFFPSLSEDSVSEKLDNLHRMSALLSGISIVDHDVTSRSSLGILPPEALDSSPLEADDDNSMFEWRKSDKKFPDFKKPFTPKTSSSKSLLEKQQATKGLDSKYFKAASTENTMDESQMPVDLDALLGSTMGDVSQGAVENFDWSRVFKDVKEAKLDPPPPKIAVIPPSSETSFDASFFKGALSGRSTSIGGVSDSNRSRTMDEKFDDFSRDKFGSLEGCKMDEVDFGPVVTDNEALMNAEEEENLEQHRFIENEVMSATNNNQEQGFDQTTNNEGFNITSQSQYFCKNTSRLGSLETSQWPPPEETRPNLGMGKIISPEKEPMKILQESINKTFTKEEQKDLDLKKLFKIIPPGKGFDSMKEMIKKIIEEKAKADVNETISVNALTSFLETSLYPDQTIDEPPPQPPVFKSPKPPKSKIPVRSPNNDKENQPQNNHLRVPMMGMKTKLPISNQKLLKKPLLDSNKKQRHSSPIKLPDMKVTPKKKPPVEGTLTDVTTLKPNASVDFPLVSNRIAVNWIAITIGEKTEESFLLKNITDKSAAVNLTIKDCEDFTLHGGKFCSEVTVDPGVSLPICLAFQPRSEGQKSGLLTMRVRGFRNQRNKSVKSSIQLRGFVGRPCLELKSPDLLTPDPEQTEVHKLTMFEMSNDVATVKEIVVKNSGTSDGFIVVQAFTDLDMKKVSHWESGAIRTSIEKAIIATGEEKKLALRIDPDIVESHQNPEFIGILRIQWGPELARKVLEANDKAPSELKFGISELGEIKRLFKSPSDSDILQCTRSIKIATIKIFGARSGGGFYSLPVEETLSESMMNVTVNQGQKLLSMTRTYATIEENDEDEEDKPKKKQVITVERDKIFVPPVKVGDSQVIKVKLRNHGITAQTLSIEGLQVPFTSNYSQIEIKPKFFLNFPVLYAPKVKGSHEITLTFSSMNDPQVAKVNVVIKGSSLKA